jgi:putative sterol carrier protein
MNDGEKVVIASSSSVFLSEDWVKKIGAIIEKAKATNLEVMELASEFSLGVAYKIEELPKRLRDMYGSERVTIYVELDKGILKKFTAEKEVSNGKDPDFTVESKYSVAKKIFLGEMNLASAFVRRAFKVKPFRRIYANPSFSAKSLTTFNVLLKVMSEVETEYPD